MVIASVRHSGKYQVLLFCAVHLHKYDCQLTATQLLNEPVIVKHEWSAAWTNATLHYFD